MADFANVQTSKSSKTTRNSADIVPFSMRYNLNTYIGFGFGPQLSVTIDETTKTESVKKFYAVNAAGPTGDEITSLEKNNTSSIATDNFKKTQASVFADVTFGFARIGPSLGVRYYKNFEKDLNYWQFYAIWKF